MVKKAIALALLCACVNCNDIFVTSNGGNATGGAGGAGGTGGSGGGVIPTPTPTPTPGSGTRTADPLAGNVLQLPQYGASVVQQVNTSKPTLVGLSCIPTYGDLGWAYLASVVQALREQDTRWGFVCRTTGCSASSILQDTIGYHATAGPEIPGALGMWTVNVIKGYCGLTPSSQYVIQGYEASSGWTLR